VVGGGQPWTFQDPFRFVSFRLVWFRKKTKTLKSQRIGSFPSVPILASYGGGFDVNSQYDMIAVPVLYHTLVYYYYYRTDRPHDTAARYDTIASQQAEFKRFLPTPFAPLPYSTAPVLVLLSQDLPSPFVIVRFARMLVPKRNSVYMVHD